MPLGNRDASQIAIKNKMKVLYGWKSQNDVLVKNGTSVRKEQPSFQSGIVPIERRQGGCKCALDASENPYEFNGLTIG